MTNTVFNVTCRVLDMPSLLSNGGLTVHNVLPIIEYAHNIKKPEMQNNCLFSVFLKWEEKLVGVHHDITSSTLNFHAEHNVFPWQY